MQEFLSKGIDTLYGIILTFITTAVIKIKNRYKANEIGTQALLRNNIITIYHRYVDLGHMPIHEKEALEHTYSAYKGLGGNGTIDSLYHELMALPVKERAKNERKN